LLKCFLKSGVESSFQIILLDSGLSSFLANENFFTILLYFVVIVIVIRALGTLFIGRYIDSSGFYDDNPPLTQAIIEKYIPSKPFSEVKNDVNCFLLTLFFDNCFDLFG